MNFDIVFVGSCIAFVLLCILVGFMYYTISASDSKPVGRWWCADLAKKSKTEDDRYI